ncbi:MAG: hypothetical protein IKD10_06445 [Lentisphaeria bacterium]|nr:hypothetical protein [Lentisphaeria bacterium]
MKKMRFLPGWCKNRFFGYFAVYAILIGVFILVSTIAAFLPENKAFVKNAQKSVSRISGEDLTRYILFHGKHNCPMLWGALLDDFTDCLILNCALNYGKNGDGSFKSAMQNNILYKTCPNPEVNWREKNIGAMVKYPDLQQPNTASAPYSRYWFGTSALVKISHYLFSLQYIYSILGVTVLLLTFLVFNEIVKKSGNIYGIAFVFLMGGLNFYVCFQSLQYSPVFIIALAGIYIFRSKTGKCCNINLFLFILGMICAYFDLLTTPLITALLPLFFLRGKKPYIQTEKPYGLCLKKLGAVKVILSIFFIAAVGAGAGFWAVGKAAKGKTIDLNFELKSSTPCNLSVAYCSGKTWQNIDYGKVKDGKIKVVIPAKRLKAFKLKFDDAAGSISIKDLHIEGRKFYRAYLFGKPQENNADKTVFADNTLNCQFSKSTDAVLGWTPDFTIRHKKNSYGSSVFIAVVSMLISCLLVMFALAADRKLLFKQSVIWFENYLLPAVMWLVGYAASWGTKLLIADCFAGKFLSSLEAIRFRSSSSAYAMSDQFVRFEALSNSVHEFFGINRILCIFVIVLTVLLLIKNIYGVYRKQQCFDFKVFAGFLCYAAIPVAFVLFFANHSQVHVHMAYRNIAIAFIALFLALTASFHKVEE